MDAKYEQRKKMIYDFMCDDMYVPMKIKELAIVLGVKKDQRPQLEQILNDLMMEGRIVCSKRGKFSKSEEKKIVGTFQAHPKGFGFVSVEGEKEDIFIPESETNGAMHMDTVEISVSPAVTGRRKEGKVLHVLERGMKQVVCTYQLNKNFGFAVPDNPKFGSDIFIPLERSKGAVNGHKVVVEITQYGKKGKNPEGKVVEILGHINDPGVDILSIVRAYGLPVEFDPKVMTQVEHVAKPVSEADMAGRMDLRDWQMVTIDGEDAKDLDDAVSLTMDHENYILGVHIADVSNYVQEHSALDTEALKRGTSVYLVDRVIPKLEKLVATIRSREISACLVLQAQSQLKAIYKDNADTIIGNMDTSIFLGGKEPTTLKELAAVLGKETIDTYNTGESRGRETSHSLNYQKLGKELMSQDELAVMDGGKCILQLRGVRPFLSDKYDITRHPNFKYTADADKRNTFDIEAFLSARLKLKPDEVCDVYEVDTEGV